MIGKEGPSLRTNEYLVWVEAFARKHAPLEWAEPKVRKKDYVRPALPRMERAELRGVCSILKGMEQSQPFRSSAPHFATDGPSDRI